METITLETSADRPVLNIPADSGPDEGSNPTDDSNLDVLENKPSDPTRVELMIAVRDLNEDERFELMALAWLERDTYDLEEWQEALETARNEHNKRAAEYLVGLPILGDHLEDGLAAFDESISDENATA